MFNSDATTIWVYLSASPLTGITITLVAYGLADRLYTRADRNQLLNPLVVSVALLIVFLMATDTSYEAYFEGGQFVHFLLGPATVALAVPLYEQISRLRKIWLSVSISLALGVTVSTVCSIAIARLLGASAQTQLSIAPKSVTTPVAMAISKQIGGLPSLTAVLVVITGIFGSIVGLRLLRLIGIRDDSVKGIAMGLTAHGLGTASSLQVSAEMGAFSGLAMALSALFASVLVPWIVGLLG
ncbi:MAG: LrgB family protein [Geitlerinemataceae cyanobacterium]